MKKIKRITVVILAAVLMAFSVCTAFAETYYEVNVYTYTLIDNNSISLVNWDTSISDTLTLPDELAGRYFTNISRWAFTNRNDLKGLDLSRANHLDVIGYEAFMGCANIETDLVIPLSVTSFNERSFAECTLLPSVTINGNITVIPKECFCYCESLKHVVLPEGLINIQPWAFGDCTALEYVEIPQSVSYIADTAFKNDPNLTFGVWYDSYGYQYAKDNNIPYVFLDDYTPGDVNLDGVVDVTDVTYVQQYAADLTEFNDLQLSLADLTGDDIIDISDATKIQRIAADME